MRRKQMPNLENGIAEEIVSVLPAGSVVRVLSDDRESIRFAVRGAEMKLRSVVFSRASLRKLVDDPLLDVKLGYLQRDLVKAAEQKIEYRYPHAVRLLPVPSRHPHLPLDRCVASV